MAIIDNALVYFKFEESSGTTAVDSVGSYNGTASTASIWNATGKIGRGILIGGSGAAYNIEYSASARKLSTDAAYSINFWFRKDSDVRMFAFGKETDGNNFVQIDFKETGEWGVFLIEGGTYSVNPDTAGQRTSGSNSNDNNWHMATIVWYDTGQSLKLYEDGNLLLTRTGMTSQNFPNVAQRIGTEREYTTSLSWDGALDEWYVKRGELTQTDITALYNSGAGLQYPFSTTSIKSINGLAYASISKINGLAISSVKSFNNLE